MVDFGFNCLMVLKYYYYSVRALSFKLTNTLELVYHSYSGSHEDTLSHGLTTHPCTFLKGGSMPFCNH